MRIGCVCICKVACVHETVYHLAAKLETSVPV